MATKVTLSSPPVQHQELHDNLEGFQVTPLEGHHHDFVQPDDTQTNFTIKRPPTPPKPKQTYSSWKQSRISKQMESNGNNNYPRSPEQTQQPSGKERKTPTMMKNQNAAYDYDNQQYLYHQQALQAESKKDHLAPPSFSKKKHTAGHMEEFFMIQEQLDQTNRERDYLIEENTQLKYHLQMLQYQVQNVEYIWQSYYAQMAADDKKQRHSWANTPSAASQQRPQRHQYSYQPDYFAGPLPPPPQLSHFGHIPPPSMIDLSPNRSPPERSNRHYQQQHGFRRHRSKSLPRKTSIPDDDDPPYSLQQPMMFPPAMVGLKFPPRQPFGRSPMAPPLLSKRYNHLQENNTSDTESGISDNEEIEKTGTATAERRHHQRHPYNGTGFMGSPMMLPFLPPPGQPPPSYSSSYPPFRYPPQTTGYDHHDENWDPRSMDRAYTHPNLPSQRSTYLREDGMQPRSETFFKTVHPSKQSSFYPQSSYASPLRHPY